MPAAKFHPICSAIDKLDKEPWDRVRQEMINDKGLPEVVADRIKARRCVCVTAIIATMKQMMIYATTMKRSA